MTLRQLTVAANGQGPEHQMLRHQKIAARELIPVHVDMPAGWNRHSSLTLARNGDSVERIYWSIKLGAAPEGYRWKRCWPNFFFKRLQLDIGGQRIWETNTQVLQMEQLICGSRGQAECLFDLDAGERDQRSREPHEVLVEPLLLKDLYVDSWGIPLIRLAFHEVRLRLETGSLADCLEPVEGAMPPPVAQGAVADELLQKCEALISYMFFDTDERREMAQANQTAVITKHMDYASELFEKNANHQIQIRVEQDRLCSAAYMWITDEQDKELPRSVVECLQVRLNGVEVRHDLTGLQSRFAMREQMPHSTTDNNKSQNLYYISYWPGRTNALGLEQGLHCSRLDMIKWYLTLKPNAPQRVKIHICHRSQNILRTVTGMAGLMFAHGLSQIRPAGQVIERPAAHIPTARMHDVTALVFPDPSKNIAIPPDEPSCMITYREFEEGESVDQCGQCHKIFSTQGLQEWLKTRAQHQWKCVHCQGPYGVATFVRGKARLGAARPERGLLNRIQNAIFGGYQPVHQD